MLFGHILSWLALRQTLAKLRWPRRSTNLSLYESRMRIDWPRHVFPVIRDLMRAHLSRISGRFIEHAQMNICGVTARRSAVACWHSVLQTEYNEAISSTAFSVCRLRLKVVKKSAPSARKYPKITLSKHPATFSEHEKHMHAIYKEIFKYVSQWA